jgi:hypothetical protein
MTRPDTLPPTCVLTVDGVRFADGAPTDDPLAPTALDSLRVTWGRSNALDQPSPATLTFKALDRTGGQHYRTALHIGSRVVVTATATLYPAPTDVMLTDPGFTAATLGAYPGNAAEQRAVMSAVVEAAPGGGQQLRLVPTAPLLTGTPGTITWGPGPVTGPTSWDAKPKAKAGQSWTFGATVAVPAGLSAVVTVRPVEFTAPDLSAWRYCPGDPAVTRTWSGGAQTITGTTQPTAGTWPGVQVVVIRVGDVWQNVPPAQTWATTAAAWTWQSIGSITIDNLVLLAPAAGADRVGRVFSGRITDLAAEWSTDADATVVTVICQDDVAELDNRYVGDVPWTTEGLNARAQRIVTASGQAITLTTDATVAAVPIAARDVDAQGAGGLLQSLARSVVGVLWNAASVGAGSFLRIEDVDNRAPMLRLKSTGAGGTVVIVPVDSQTAVNSGGITLDACEVLLEPVQWTQTTEDDSTRVALTWSDPSTTPATSRTETAINATAETATGRRRVAITTELNALVDAQRVAQAALGRLTTPGWRVDGITWTMLLAPITPDTLQRVMKVLDGVTRLGLPVLIVGLPSWSPISPDDTLPLYLEGGQFTYSLGGWTLELLTSSARAQGQAGARWQDLATGTDWQWQDFDPAISWGDLRGVGVT